AAAHAPLAMLADGERVGVDLAERHRRCQRPVREVEHERDADRRVTTRPERNRRIAPVERADATPAPSEQAARRGHHVERQPKTAARRAGVTEIRDAEDDPRRRRRPGPRRQDGANGGRKRERGYDGGFETVLHLSPFLSAGFDERPWCGLGRGMRWGRWCLRHWRLQVPAVKNTARVSHASLTSRNVSVRPATFQE